MDIPLILSRNTQMKLLIFSALLFASPFGLYAQSVSGTITDINGKALVGVSVQFLKADDTTIIRGVITNVRGKYQIKSLQEGEYLPRVYYLGYNTFYGNKISVPQINHFNAVLELLPVQMDNVVVTASRVSEKASEAPASISVVGPQQIKNTNAIAPAEFLRGIAGIDIAQSGIGQQTVTARGFSNVFSGQLMMLADYRNAAVPSLRANISYLTPITDADIERIEIARGPGSALYGPNASNGVVNIITKSPFSSQGTTIELTGGEREFFSATARNAGVVGDNFGYKISGNYTRGRDWPYRDSVEQENKAAEIQRIMNDPTIIDKRSSINGIKIGNRDNIFERCSIDGRIEYILGDNALITMQGGYSAALRSIELTDLSAAQAKNWGYGYGLIRLDYGRLMAQSFVNFSNSGETFLLRSGNPIVDHSKQIVGRLQHSASLGEHQEFTYGGDMFLTRPQTDGTIMGENESHDNINEFGIYLQSKTSLLNNFLDIIIAGRYDYHNRLNNGVFSPRVAFVFKPLEKQSFRLTYNSGYTAPYPFDLFADIRYTDNAFRSAGFPDAYGPAVYVKGVPLNGFSFLRDVAGSPLFRTTFLKDRTQTLPLAAMGDLWDAATPFVQNAVRQDTTLTSDIRQLIIDFLNKTHTTTGDKIGGQLKLINNATGQFDAVANAYDIKPLKPTITKTFELGYTGILHDMLRASIDVYSSKINNFISSSRSFTPNVFMNPSDVSAFLEPKIKQSLIAMGYAETQASAAATILAGRLGEGYAQIPLGTAAVAGVTDPTAILFAPRNFGEVNLWGSDVAIEFRPNPLWTFYGTTSFVSQNIFKKVDGIADVPLNAPQYKASLAASYNDEQSGLNFGIRWRWTDSFEMVSGIFNGIVQPYNLIDLNAGCDIPSVKGLKAILAINNALDFMHQEFIGAPYIGRMTTLRATYSF